MRGWLLLLLLGVAGCHPRPPPTALHYELGSGYQQAGVWHYPREAFALRETGLAMVEGAHAGLTADGEEFDQGAMAVGHPTLQLPALGRLTDLDTGRSVLVRINDRGPDSAVRSLGVTRRVAALLGAGDGAAIPYRLELLEEESRRMVQGLRADARVEIASAPAGVVQSEALAPPPGVRSVAGGVAVVRPVPAVVPVAAVADGTPLRLPETVTQDVVRPHGLAIDCAAFSRVDYANLLRGRLQALGAVMVTDYSAPRDRAYVVRIPGLADAAMADDVLRRARAAGATDARIVVD